MVIKIEALETEFKDKKDKKAKVVTTKPIEQGSGDLRRKKMIIHIQLVGYQGVDDINIDPWGGMDAQVQKLKAWKKARKVGTVRIKPGNMLGPIDEICAR